MKRPVAIGLGVGVVALAAVLYFVLGTGHGTVEKSPPTTTTDIGPIKTPGGRATPSSRGDFDTTGRPSNDALIDDDPAGALRLEGQVVGDGDQPVANATVVLSSNPPRVTATEQDGSFAFDHLVGRPYTLVARGPGGIAGPITARLTATTAPVILHLRPATTVVVSVVDEKGEAVASAAVELRGLDEQAMTAGPDGKATFAPVVPGGYDVVAHAPGFAPGNEPARIGGDRTEVKVVLGKGAAVSGVVVDDRGNPVAGARVVYSGASDWSRQGDERKDAAISGKDGAFAFEAIPAGTFRFVARHPEKAPGSSALVTLDGATPRDHVEIRLPPGATVRGNVVDANGAAIPSARVRIGAAGAGMVAEAPRQVFTDDAGAFVVTGLPRRPLAAVALSEDAASANVPVDTTSGDVDKVVLKLDVTGTIAGTVVDEGGQPLEGVQVSAFPDFRAQRKGSGEGEMSSWRLRGFPQDLTDASGAFTLVGLAPGDYRVRATRSRAAARGRGFAGEGTSAATGTKDLRIVLPPEGSVKGKVTYADGSAVGSFTVGVGFTQEPVSSKDGAFVLDGLAPDHYQLSVKGMGFVGKSVDIDVKGGAATDVGTITVVQGRSIKGTVVAAGKPVPGATVWAGRQIFGNGSSNDARFGGGPPMAQGTRKTTTGEDGSWSMSGFGLSDITIVAEEPTLGRSAAVRIEDGDPNAQALVLTLAPFGALKGVLKQGTAPAEGVIVSAQSVSSPGAFYSVATGPDGAYRFDKLAPDSYKVSAMLGMPMRGMKFYSKTVVVESGKEAVVDLQYQPGAVSLAVTAAVPAGGKIGAVSAWLASGVMAAKNGRDLQLKMAAQGAGSSQWNIVPMGGQTTFTELTPGTYSACLVPFPAEVAPMAGMEYAMKYSDVMAVYCKTVNVAASPAEQSVSVPVEIPVLIKDDDTGGTPAPPRGGRPGAGQ